MTDPPPSGQFTSVAARALDGDVSTLGPAAAGTSARVRSDERAREARFDAIYAEQFRFVWRTLQRLGVHAASLDDAAQDVFVVLHRRLDELDETAPVRVWLFRVVVNVAREHRRRVRRKGGLDPLGDEIADAAPSPHDAAVTSQAMRTLDRLLETLDEDKRAVFVLAELEQMSAPEIAAALGVKPNTVYSRLRAARADFEAAVARHRRGEP